MEKAGIRVTRAEFSRIMGCSKQAVTEWVKSGRVTLGADGRLDPRQAVAQLLRTGDPSRLRSKVLAPLVSELQRQAAKISKLAAAAAAAAEDAEFFETSASDLSQLLDQFKKRLLAEWADLVRLPPGESLAAILGWLDVALEKGLNRDLGFLDHARNVASEKGLAETFALLDAALEKDMNSGFDEYRAALARGD